MPTLYFSKEFEGLVKELCTKSAKPELVEVFPRYRDLMLFAAMVGKKEGRKIERSGNGGEVESNYFKSAGFNKEGVIYLLGLLDFGDPEVLKGGAPDCWKLFESYCNGGMQIIQEWLSLAESPEDYADILRSRLLEMAKASKKVEVKVKKPKIPKIS